MNLRTTMSNDMQDFLQRVRAVLVADFLTIGFDVEAASELADIEMELSR